MTLNIQIEDISFAEVTEVLSSIKDSIKKDDSKITFNFSTTCLTREAETSTPFMRYINCAPST